MKKEMNKSTMVCTASSPSTFQQLKFCRQKISILSTRWQLRMNEQKILRDQKLKYSITSWSTNTRVLFKLGMYRVSQFGEHSLKLINFRTNWNSAPMWHTVKYVCSKIKFQFVKLTEQSPFKVLLMPYLFFFFFLWCYNSFDRICILI